MSTITITFSTQTLTIGAHVRICVGYWAGLHSVVEGIDTDRLVAPIDVRPEGWDLELPPLQFEADELEVEA